ncbi:Small COPII coat GTPase SAR1 [Nosema bombycis CQ1]|uniref:Small COPII coat GTPase SAR1 n=1 Tax=Nosema bombycis (strain CQ1 / CVCC 102059) TaxID=578461 RepID=R0MF09_NOSB1|nr:Small COPII coat GTPase SAR1 [Nosema bombycis CQ1]|eukprot:EOB12720.1 Small COPII coat GTPase SAR1 [Nosema bombycis CQ1]
MEEAKKLFGKFRELINTVYEKTLANFVRGIFSKPSSILFLGIDNAGKTTLVKKLKHGVNDTYMPTRHPSKSQIEIGNLRASVVDLGGHKAARVAWNNYFYNCDGIIFIVDVNDTERFEEVKEAYQNMRALEKKAPIAVLMNKVDLVGRDPLTAGNDVQWTDELSESTGIYNEPVESGQPVNISYVSIIHENADVLTGPLATSFKWLEIMINQQKK